MHKTKIHEASIICGGAYHLAGTLAVPETNEKKYPAVLLVAGSGQVDRDGNFIKIKTNLYKDLAEIITSLGFITLRYDKRGIRESGGNYFETGMWDLIDDINSWVAYLRNHPQVDPERIVLLGHSEGCTLITGANAGNPINGLIMLAGAAEPMHEALKCQRKIIFSELLNLKGFKGFLMRLIKVDEKGEKQAKKFLDKVLNSGKATLKHNFTTVNAKWYREHFSYDLLADLRRSMCPILAVTGSKDFQANPNRIKSVSDLVGGEAVCVVIEDMDHGLKEHKGQISALNSKVQYESSSTLPVHPELIKILSSWLKNHFQFATNGPKNKELL